ncbi:MAG: acyl carrier protein [Clostridiales bacterium]|nr:acyl carrier protein [Clostridiales bacterium]
MDKENSRNRDNIRKILRGFITQSFLPQAGLKSFSDADSFLENGIIDSTGILELLEFIEDKFQIKVEDEEIIPDNLDSLANLTTFVSRKLANAG